MTDTVSEKEIFLDMLKNRDGFYYLASPYSRYPDGLEAAFVEVCQAAAWLIENGICVFCPIAHSHPIALHGGIDPARHDIWMPADTPLLIAAEGLIVCQLPGWSHSQGVTAEIALARKLDKPMFMMRWPR